MLIQKSFYTFQQQKALPGLRAEHQGHLERLSSPELVMDDLEAVAELHAALYAERGVRDELRAIVNRPIHSLPFVQAGRLCQVRAPCPDSEAYHAGSGLSDDFGWGIIVDFKKRKQEGDAAGAAGGKKDKKRGGGGDDRDAGGPIENVTVDVLLRCAPGALEAVAGGEMPSPAGEAAESAPSEAHASTEMHVVSVPLAHVDRLSSVRVKLPADLTKSDARYSMLKGVCISRHLISRHLPPSPVISRHLPPSSTLSHLLALIFSRLLSPARAAWLLDAPPVLREVGKRFPEGVPLLDPTEEMKVDDERVPKLLRRLEAAQTKLADERLADAALHARLPALHARLAAGAECKAVSARIKEVEAVMMKDELKSRRRVLRRLGHLSDDGVIQNKGRVACELSTADELLTTELVRHRQHNRSPRVPAPTFSLTWSLACSVTAFTCPCVVL